MLSLLPVESGVGKRERLSKWQTQTAKFTWVAQAGADHEGNLAEEVPAREQDR